jgi:integrase
MGKLTGRFITSIIPPQSGSRLYWDDTVKGFGVRVSRGGTKTFVVSYRTENRRQRRMSIGRCAVLTAAQARRRAVEILAEVALGGDPAGDRRRRKQEVTFGHLAGEYIDRHTGGKRSGAEDIRIIRKDLLGSLGPLRIGEIGRRDVIELVNTIVDRGSPIMANRTLALVRKIFNFGVEQALASSNPCSGVKMPCRERKRDRVLSGEEIAAFWHNLPCTRISKPVQNILNLILITAQRPGEVAGAEWAELGCSSRHLIDAIEGESGTIWWTIPEERSKNRLSHRVPLSYPALRIIRSCSQDGRFIFPSPRDSEKHIGISSLSHAVRKNLDDLGLEPFTPHDLRRTAASQMAGMGISRIVISRILNHAESGITAVYDRYGYDCEKLEALEALAGKLMEIIDGF